MKINDFKKLIVWQKAIELVKEIYKVCKELPPSEQFNLISQMQRAVISIPSNIAEGYKRQGTKEYLHFLSVAEASVAELETQTIIVGELYPEINTIKAKGLILEVQKMLYSIIRKLK